MRFTINCPHCNSRPFVRSSRFFSPTLRELVFICSNAECGHSYAANLEVVRTLSPSAMPNPDIRLPMSPHTKARMMEQLKLI